MSSGDETSVIGKEVIEQAGGGVGEDQFCGDSTEDDVWVNPSTSAIIECMMNQ